MSSDTVIHLNLRLVGDFIICGMFFTIVASAVGMGLQAVGVIPPDRTDAHRIDELEHKVRRLEETLARDRHE